LVLVLSPDSLTVGASGAVFGLAGAGLVVAWRQRRYFFLVLVAAWAITNLLFTISTPGISVAGHFGGLLGGALLGLLFARGPERADGPPGCIPGGPSRSTLRRS
jgi:membrane associated rhomboid family serine protease